MWQNNAQRPLSPISNGKSRSVDTRPAVASPVPGVKARASTSECRLDVASPVPQHDATSTSKPASMLNRFKLFNSRDRSSAGASDHVNGVAAAAHPSSTSPAPKRQLPTYSSTQKVGGSQIPSYSAAGTFLADGGQQMAQSPAPSGRYGSPGTPQRQRAPPPPERHASSGLQEPRHGRALPPGGPPSEQYAGAEAASTSSFGFAPNRYQQQQRAVQSRCNQREIFIDRAPDDAAAVAAAAAGCDGSRSSLSSVPSRTASSTSISSVASSSTTGGGPVARRSSGLARRVSSSAQPDKRAAKTAAASPAVAAGSSRVKSARSSSSSIPAPSAPGSVNRAAAKQADAGAARRQKGSTTTVETTPTEHGGKPGGRALIPRRNSSRVGQLTDRGGVDVMSPGSGRKLPQVVNSRRSATPETEVANCSTSDAVTANRKSTADSSTNASMSPPPKPSRMPQPSVSAAPHPSSGASPPPPTSPRLSLPATDSPDVEQRRAMPVSQDDRHPSTPVSVTAPPSPAIGGPAALMLPQRSASVGRPAKEKSNSSISSGFGDESNNSTSDSADSVIFQSSTASSRVTAEPPPSNNALTESSSSAIDSDSPPSESTAAIGVREVDTSAGDGLPTSSPAPAQQTVDHITSLRVSRRHDDVTSRAPAVDDAAPTPSHGEKGESSRTELIDAFDCIKPMQPLVRSSIPCCVYEPPSARRLPTLLAQSTAGTSASRRLVFARPPLGPGATRAALGGRAGTRESAAACGYMSDGDVVRGCGVGAAAVGRAAAAERLMSGYTSEGGGGGGVTSYARRMQQRFLEGILAVRQSMKRAPQFTDDDRSDTLEFIFVYLNQMHFT